MSENSVTIDGEMLRAMRKEKKFTQKQLADLLEYKVQNISNIEREKNHKIPKEKAEHLACILQVPVEFLYPSDLPINNMEIHHALSDISQFIDRLFYNVKDLREHDLPFLRKIMEELKFNELSIQYFINKIQKAHEAEQIEISEFINRICYKDLALRRSDIIWIRRLLINLTIYELDRKNVTDNNIGPEKTTEMKIAMVKKIESIITEIQENRCNDTINDLSENNEEGSGKKTQGTRLLPFNKYPSFDLKERVTQNIYHEISDDNDLHLINILVNHLNDFNDTHKKIIIDICKSSESDEYKKNIFENAPVNELIFDFVFTSLTPYFNKSAYDLIFGELFKTDNFDPKQKNEYIQSLKKQLDSLSNEFIRILNEEMVYWLPENQTNKNMIYRWLSKTIMPLFFKEACKIIDENALTENDIDKLNSHLKTQREQLTNAFSGFFRDTIKSYLTQIIKNP